MTTIVFDDVHKYIRIDFDEYVLSSGNTIGSTIVVVTTPISTLTPTSGQLLLGHPKEEAERIGSKEWTTGYDWASSPENFILTTNAGGPSTIYLNQNCPTFDDVINYLNDRLANADLPHSTYVRFEKCPLNSLVLEIDTKEEKSGSPYGFQILDGSPNALTTFKMHPGQEQGHSDIYYYSSYSNNTFYLTGTLTSNYTSGYSAVAGPTEVDMQEIYNKAMQWAATQPAMDDVVPVEAVGKKSIGGGLYTDIVYSLMYGWKLKFFPGKYHLQMNGTTITNDGTPKHVLNQWGNPDVTYSVGTGGLVVSPIIDDTEATNVATKVWTVPDGARVRKERTNRWRIDTTTKKLYIYDDDGTTVIATFDLKDASGQPSSENVYERVPV